MPLQKLQFRPGVFRDNTQYSGEGGWYDCDKIRFRLGYPEQIGGWLDFLPGQSYFGVSRHLHQWTSLAFNDYVAMGTNSKLYVIFQGVPHDITPLRRTASLGADPFASIAGVPTLVVHDVANGSVLGDFVTFSGATAFDNFTTGILNADFEITQIIDADNYVVTTSVSATASTSGGGAGVTADYLISVGLVDATTGVGWGAGPYGISPYGTSYSTSVTAQLRIWRTDNFGEDLIANYRNGNYYYWDLSASVDTAGVPNARAVVLSSVAGANSVPTIGLSLGVSDSDRHLIAFGSDDYGATGLQNLLLCRWCAQEQLLDWEPRADNSAGSLPLALGSQIIGYQKTRAEFLVWTDRALYSLHFVGPPYWFAVNQISDSVSLIGPNACGEGAGLVFWADGNAFYLYNGSIQPIECPVRDYVFQNFNRGQAFKTTCAMNSRFNEVMWFYPSADSTENNRYALYNYVENTWAIGSLERTAWADLAYQGYPLATSATKIYQHEIGYDDDNGAMASYVESCDTDLGDGETFTYSRRWIPDMVFRGGSSVPQVEVSWKTRNYPGAGLLTAATTTVGPSTTQGNIRLRARQIVFRIDADGNAIGWRLGAPRIDVQQDGRK